MEYTQLYTEWFLEPQREPLAHGRVVWMGPLVHAGISFCGNQQELCVSW